MWFRHRRCQSEQATSHLMPIVDFEAGINDPATRDATIARTLNEIANGPSYAHLTYDPFTFKSRIYGPYGRYR